MAYYIIGGDGKTYGPKPDREIREWIREGRLNATSNIASEGSEDWRPLSKFPEFAADLNPAAAPAGAVQPPQVIQPQTQPYPQYAAAAPSGTNGMAITGMICGIVSLPMLCCCYGLPFNILGVVFSLIALSQLKANPHQEGRGMAIAGLICAGISLLLIVVLVGFGVAMNVFSP
jgi:hypothetical protein